jgi:RNA polymerase sigma factor (TIGR02999 family)
MTNPDAPTPELTSFLAALAGGEGGGDVTRLEHVLKELRVIAASQMRRQGPGHTLQPTALVNAAYLKLFRCAPGAWKDRGHFYTVAAKAMRQVLVDHARARMRAKRGGGRRAGTLIDAPGGQQADAELLDVDEALSALAAFDEAKARVVELRYFGGFEVAEVAEMMGTSKSTVEREWRAARAWLAMRLRSGEGSA